jgi:hypothetical protein
MGNFLSALALLALLQSAHADESAPSPPPAPAPTTYALTVSDGKLGGPGSQVLRSQLPNAQFILFGEDHGFADSPILLRAIAQEARPLGFKYHVVEVGPLSVQMIRDTLKHAGVDGVHKLVHETPLGIPFLSLKDDLLLASDFQGQDAKGAPYLWGVDQEFIGSPPFHLKRLVAIAPNDAARAAAQKLLDAEIAAAATAAQQDFLLVRYTDADFDALAAQFKGNAEAERIIAELKESAAVYQLWMHGKNYENNARRARLLAKNFLTAYNAAADKEPRVVFKMGIEHLTLGTTSINTIDLGTLATEMARIHGKTALRIAFLPTGGHNLAFRPQPGNPATEQVYKGEEAEEFFTAIGIDPGTLARDSWTLVPLEPVRQALDTKGIEKLKPGSRAILIGYDYVITTPDAKAGVSLY